MDICVTRTCVDIKPDIKSIKFSLIFKWKFNTFLICFSVDGVVGFIHHKIHEFDNLLISRLNLVANTNKCAILIRRCNMSKKDKLISRLLELPKDFTYEEMISLLKCFCYELKQSNTGSGVKFVKNNSNEVINFHRPHPGNHLKRYVLEQVICKLRKDGLI